jgi:hypothetical protein
VERLEINDGCELGKVVQVGLLTTRRR